MRKIKDVCSMKEVILQNFWHYQEKYHKGNKAKRWTFICEADHPAFPIYAQGIVLLQQEGLVAFVGENKMFCLTDKGYDFCEFNKLSLSPEDRFYEEY